MWRTERLSDHLLRIFWKVLPFPDTLYGKFPRWNITYAIDEWNSIADKAKMTESHFKSSYNQYIGFQWSACTHTSQDGQKHTMNFNNLNTIGRITVHSTFVKLFGIRDLCWENNSKTVEKIAFCLLGTTTLYFLCFFLNLHAFTDFTQIHLLAYTTTVLKQLTNKNTIKMVATRLCKREDLRCKPCHLSVLAISCK